MRKIRLLLSDGTPYDLDIPRQSLSDENVLNLFVQRQGIFSDDWIPTGTGDRVLNRYQVTCVTVVDDGVTRPVAAEKKSRLGFLRRREVV
jgi:hypothetical protein